jgi:hypothetical protein
MTYPPQPGQPGPYGQQPQQGQHGGQQPPIGPGQYGRYGQAPVPQQYAGPPGHPGGEPPKSKRGLVIAIVVAVLVLAGGGTTVWLLTRGDDDSDSAAQDPTTQQSEPTADDPTSEESPTSEPTSAGAGAGDPNAVSTVAQEYVTAVNGVDEAAATQLTCDKSTPGTLYEVVAGQGQVQAGEVTMVSDDTATVGITLQGGSSASTPLRLLLEDGAWCVAI